MPYREEEQWAVALKKAQQKTRLAAQVPVGVRRGQIQEQLSLQKNLLERALAEQNHVALQKSLDQLVQLRAEQTALALKEMEELYGTVAPEALAAHVRQYYADCTTLVSALP